MYPPRVHVVHRGNASRVERFCIATARGIFASPRSNFFCCAHREKMATASNPHVWGPPLWDTLFAFAFCDTCEMRELRRLLGLIGYILPCKGCCDSYMQSRSMLPPLVQVTRETAATWLWTMHDVVNQKLAKTTAITFDVLQQKHRTFGTQLLSDATVLQLLCIMAHNTDKREQLVRAIAAFVKLLRECVPTSTLHRHVDGVAAASTESAVRDALFDATNAMRAEHQLDALTRDEFACRYT